MAALSCYQPCRSHLAQPARCLNEEELAPAFSFRRRQFIERCHDSRAYRGRETAPVEVSVKKARDEVTKTPSGPLRRRLNVDSGWSKVEEVRKKFEGATLASSGTFSRSFESPPRRRLADSLFASFKLPRNKEGMAAPRCPASAPQAKRKSAVELLAETKAFYVKSETVRDRKQELPLRVSCGLSQAIAAGGCHLVSSGTLNNDTYSNPYATTGRLHPAGARRVSGEGLQTTLRRLLDHADSRENVYSPYAPYSPPSYAVPHKPYSALKRNQQTTLSGTSSSGTSGSKAQAKSDPGRSDKNRPRSFADARVFFPESFVIPRQTVVKTAFTIPSPDSSPSSMGAELCAEQIGAITPPAQYAHSAPRYIRSVSHSQPSAREDDVTANINSHKSLPDLHTQARCYTEHGPVSTDITGRSPRRRRHSTHQRTASCSSKGTRSNHSSLMSSYDAFSEHPSPEDNYQYNSRSGSFARDSGGSSGHYTQRSAPALPPHQPTDSGSSTQHDNSRYAYYYACPPPAPAQFQDGAPPAAPAAPALPPLPPHATCVGIHFQASAPPPQFQDDLPAPTYYDECDGCYNNHGECVPRKDYHRDYHRYHETNTELISKQPQYSEPRRPRADDTQEYVNTTQVQNAEDVTSPLGTFKRQRCLRYKQRRPRPILRSKSDISDRYRRTEGRSPASAPCEAADSGDSVSSSSSRLRQFFTLLGLEPRAYERLISPPPGQPVYFSSCTSVDSNHQDYTVQGPVSKPIYRNTDPPSVVERNARIVKWLCQCRKTMAQPDGRP